MKKIKESTKNRRKNGNIIKKKPKMNTIEKRNKTLKSRY